MNVGSGILRLYRVRAVLILFPFVTRRLTGFIVLSATDGIGR